MKAKIYREGELAANPIPRPDIIKAYNSESIVYNDQINFWGPLDFFYDTQNTDETSDLFQFAVYSIK